MRFMHNAATEVVIVTLSEDEAISLAKVVEAGHIELTSSIYEELYSGLAANLRKAKLIK